MDRLHDMGFGGGQVETEAAGQGSKFFSGHFSRYSRLSVAATLFTRMDDALGKTVKMVAYISLLLSTASNKLR